MGCGAGEEKWVPAAVETVVNTADRNEGNEKYQYTWYLFNSVYYTLRNRPTYKDVIHKFKYNVVDTQTPAASYIYNEITCFQIERNEFLRTAVTYLFVLLNLPWWNQ